MTVIPKENVKINPYARHVEIRNLNGDKYILEDEKPLKNENNIEKEALKYERIAKRVQPDNKHFEGKQCVDEYYISKTIFD